MDCPSCRKPITPDSLFCMWCSKFIPSPGKGEKANLFTRWLALSIDFFLAVLLYFSGILFFGSISPGLGFVMAIVLPFVYVIWFLIELARAKTPGKQLLGLQVVHQQTGEKPGFGKMFVREIVGRFISAIVFGIGYLWAIFDKNGQAWHDKIAGTVVLKVPR